MIDVIRRAVLLVAVLASVAPGILHAQVDPSHHWLTLTTPHFRVTFTRPVEPLARRVAADAERAYSQLSAVLHPPRGMIDVVLSDDIDASNGSATPYPTNRITIYATPPVSESALRYTTDWAQMVITHELTHIFHLDRTRGIWSIGQHVFGRAAALFPNLYDPSWLTEGLAVYEESRLTGAGRVNGSEHRMIARAAALGGDFPALGALSLAQGRFPFGESAYSYGSLFVDDIAKTKGDSAIRAFVDKSAANVIPYLIDVPARQAFGETFGTAWRHFADSIAQTIGSEPRTPMPTWRELTHDGVDVFGPRWFGDSSLTYSGTGGRESFGAYRVDLAGRRTRIGRRNSRSPNALLSDGGLLYAQVDFVNPYQVRSDLWVQRGRREHQLTANQRLTNPDVRADGLIVAEQIVSGATRLVLVSRDGMHVTPLTTGSFDEQWTQPRWSHDGGYIAASRWLRGNLSQIVIVDTTGTILHIVSSGTSIEATPSWLSKDIGIFYSSDRTGVTQIYAEQFNSPGVFSPSHTVRLSDASTGLFEPSMSPNGKALASVLFRSDGYHLGVATSAATEPVPAYRDTLPRGVPPVVADTSRVSSYSAWHTVLPRYWLPTLDPGLDNGYRLGGSTSGVDVLGRHALTASLGVPLNNRGGLVGDFSYQYKGLGLPILVASAAQDWESLGSAYSRDAPQSVIGEIFRRARTANVSSTWLRQRVRNALSVTAGVGMEYRSYASSPNDVLARVDTGGALNSHTFPTVTLAAGYSNAQLPPFGFSPEDGVQLNATVRDRTRSGPTGDGGQSFSTVGSAALYKSLNLPGFAHHVLALRGAGGISDERAAGYYSVGGISGNAFEIVPGYTIGEGRKTFPVRGFASGTLIGTRAVAGSAEYRLPLLLIGNSPGTLPFFLDRSSLTLFGDYGSAWCPTAVEGAEVCNRASQLGRYSIGSVGGELNVDLGVLSWDSPYRFRLGLVHPVQNAVAFGARPWQIYLVAGISF